MTETVQENKRETAEMSVVIDESGSGAILLHLPNGESDPHVAQMLNGSNPDPKGLAENMASSYNNCRGINPEAVPRLIKALVELADDCESEGVEVGERVSRSNIRNAREALALSRSGS